ncbi:glycosyltransferase [Desertifilum sp. FACHB-1129]|uniref:Glycosyltransferase n=1 Tax=Desertifilum tharense IPPAS B-1220 TaxID=1781255 RepID=A0A1E5QNL9_9CYAN|nr:MULTISPECIES: glycosyltransferase [Desertifilum]MDA0208797.1 glycosyltransferase [Cyanobacteria bacterium FC1]MBD2310999.1 glycosyltransferase [Desertifilum sp. FACHB-1129]MBD2321404.1 glycosyltransferase [Desertifilum sp. FACHB-866]MBD2331289.1 glycosyltransferase [Desertifilum sp. FACHB-868]OEJ75943.1 glycosyltransferase [Desertifilum tharense IPPAS B-1220]
MYNYSQASKISNFHLWFPNIFGFKGGIQVYSAFLLQALQEIYPESEYEVFLKLDKQATPDLTFLDKTQFHFVGGWPKLMQTPVFATQLLGYGVGKRPDLAIATHINFTLAANWLKRVAGVPYWAIAHGVEAWDIQQPRLQQALANADRILAVSEYTRDRLLKEQNLDPHKVGLLPNTFDESRFQICPKPAYLLERYNLSADRPLILTVGRLSETDRYKGYDRIIEALPTILQQIPNAHYLIVGKGKDRDRVERLIQQLNLQNHVTLAGFIPDEELCDHYNLCDLFAMPSKGEGFGIVYLEALACGKPTLGGNQDGAIDALCRGKLGALVDPNSVEEIAQTAIAILNRTYDNPLMYQPEALRQAVIDTFGFKRFVQTLAALFSPAISYP